MTKTAQQSGVARRYAEALFDLAKDAGSLETVEGDLKTLGAAMTASADLSGFLKSPVYDAEDKGAAMAAIAEKSGASDLTRNFIGLVARNNRLFALDGMIIAFAECLAEHRGEVRAEAVSAAPLNDDQIRRLRGEIEGVIGKAVNLTTRVDADLLGGLVVKVGSKMIDSSLRTKLNRLKTKLKEA
jgi:F-type H+-transporting ATPase subunit delta